MGICADLLERLGPDASTSVLVLLDDPADLVRVSAVSKSWRRFVIRHSFSKKLCLRLCSEVSCFTSITEENSTKENVKVGSSSAMEWEYLEREHRAYSYLSHCFSSSLAIGDCIAKPIYASSTDNNQNESIENTLIEVEQLRGQPSYWSSKGENDPGVPETLTYRMGSKLCIINEINVWPFKAYFQDGGPIYSAKAVRFRMGYSIPPLKKGEDPEKFIWTYVSQKFPMLQENELQTFKLPRPVLCIGGIVQIELLGRVQRQEKNNLYYICICHVQVVGHPLSPVFEVDIDETSGSSILKYFPEKRTTSASESSSCWRTSASGSPPYWRTCACRSSSCWQTCACGFSSGWSASESSSNGRSFGLRENRGERNLKRESPSFSDVFIWFAASDFEDDEPEGGFPWSFV